MGRMKPSKRRMARARLHRWSKPEPEQNLEENVNEEVTQNLNICGRRIIDVMYFFEQLKVLNDHEPFSCNLTHMAIVQEIRIGLVSTFTLKCSMCNIKKCIKTEADSVTDNINSLSVFGALSVGIGHSAISEQHAIINMPSMSYRQFDKHFCAVSEKIMDKMWANMKAAGEEEFKLAMDVGDVDEDGHPFISVIVDGAWSKRSYKLNYDALSGVACIIGAKTGQILFISTRNKYCSICKSAVENNNVPEHICTRNWSGSSTAMEADIILEGFKYSVQQHNLKYTTIIGDGDSSVYRKLCLAKPYGPKTLISKIECTNHLLRNYCGKLREVANKRMSSTNKFVSPAMRREITSRIIRMRMGIKKALEYRRKEEKSMVELVESLTKDIKNCPKHVFGDHANCDEYFCTGPKLGEQNMIPALEECGALRDIELCGSRLCQNAHSLLLNMTNNAAECYNSIVSKFVGGKRLNFSIKNSYDVRCRAAAVSFNNKLSYYSIVGSTRNYYVQKHANKRQKVLMQLKKRIRKRKQIKIKPADEDYGNIMEIDDENIKVAKQNLLNSFSLLTKTDLINIERETIGQSNNPLWKKHRHLRLTASNFGNVCKLRSKTDPNKLAKRIIQSNNIKHIALQWGRDNEIFAKKDFSSKFLMNIEECGLFIFLENPSLAASPDGLIGEDAIAEIKCPYSIRHYTPEDAVNMKKINYLNNVNGNIKLKIRHIYYYQVQGQLAITGRKKCYFIVWTPKGIIVDVIERNDEFWKKEMLPKLQQFYNTVFIKHLLS